MYPFGSLPDNLIAFCAVLNREYRFRIGAAERHDAARALEVVRLADERAVRHALRPVLSRTPEDAAVFDRAFTDFFFPGPQGVPQHGRPDAREAFVPESPENEERADASPSGSRRAEEAADKTDEEARLATAVRDSELPAAVESESLAPAILARAAYSPLAADAGGAGPELAPVDAEWLRAARTFVRRADLGRWRRWRTAASGRRFDLRRTLRASLQTGGEAIAPRWLRRQVRTPRFVLLIDGSRSMDAYTAVALQLAVAIASVTMRVEVFTFSTSLRRVTEEVRRAAAGTRRRLAHLQHAWGGGTSIGSCLRECLQRFGDRSLGRATVVIIASDGLDIGEPDLLRDAVREMSRRSAAVVWLNPLVGTPGYEPTAAGMKAARPFVTTFTRVGDAAGLVRLSRLMRVR